jgi:hypothetical protein
VCPSDRRLARQTPGGLGQQLRKLEDSLSNAGCVRVETHRVGRKRTRMIYLATLDPAVCGDVAANASMKSVSSADNADSVCTESTDVRRALELAIASVIR